MIKATKLLFYFGFALVLFASCANPKAQKKTMDKKGQITVKEPQVIRGFAPKTTYLDYSVTNAVLSDTLLTVTIEYTGGCADHIFDLVFNGLYKKSLPRKADLFIKHNHAGDTCRQKKVVQCYFDLSSLIGTDRQDVDFTLIGYPQKIAFRRD